MQTEINFEAIQAFGLVVNEVELIFRVLFGKN